MSVAYKFDYVNIAPTETLENIAFSKLKPLERRVNGRMGGRDEETEVHVRIVADHRAVDGSLRDSHVVIEVKVPGIPKKLVANKKDEDVVVALNKSCNALLKEVRRYTRKQEHVRKHPKA